MTHPYPPRWASFPYLGGHRYALTFVTDTRRPVFVEAGPVDLVLSQILRAATEERFAVIAHCFMPDHLHLVVGGQDADSDCKAFIKSRLWERYGHDRVIRDEQELAMTI